MVRMFLLLLILPILACGSAPTYSLIGSWKLDDVKTDADHGMRLNSDGTWEDWFLGRNVNVRHRGTYALAGTRLTVTQTEVTFTNGKVDRTRKVEESTVKWISKDKVAVATLTPDGPETGTWTRQTN
jgi:hypothetical protein